MERVVHLDNGWSSTSEQFHTQNIDALLLVKQENLTKENVRYVSGFTGSSAYVLIHPERRVLLTDDRYTEQAAQQCPQCEIIRHEKPFTKQLSQVVADLNISRLGYEAPGITVAMWNTLSEALPDVELVATTGIVEQQRAIKGEDEIALIRRACQLADQGYAHLLERCQPGISERELASSLEAFLRQQGADGLAFNMILVSSSRTSHQHGSPSERCLEPGDFVLADFGALYKGYRSDITRTFVLGPISTKQREVYEVVRQAQAAALSMLKAGASGVEICTGTRRIIEDEGYGDYTAHGVGHGVGLEIHEDPFVTSANDVMLQVGHVITVEPGIYIPDWGGVRIEDTVVITETGCRVLTESPKELRVL